MSHGKGGSKVKHWSKAVSVLGITGMSLTVADGGASASISGSAGDILNAGPRQLVTLDEEEIFDVNLSTFYVFDKENAPIAQAGVQLARACGGRGCGVWQRLAQTVNRGSSREAGALAAGSCGRDDVSESIAGEGPVVLEHAFRLGVEAIVSKRSAHSIDPGRGLAWRKTLREGYVRNVKCGGLASAALQRLDPRPALVVVCSASAPVRQIWRVEEERVSGSS